MNGFFSEYLTAQNLSHERRETSFQAAEQVLIDKIKNRGDLPHISVDKQLELLHQLTEFEFGQFLIERGGLNGYWTHYVITHPNNGRLTQRNCHNEPFHPLESFLLNSAPTILATQQRFALFKDQIQKYACEGCSFASIPSGLMGDLLDLDYSLFHTFSLYGIDLDPETLAQAASYAEEKNLLHHCHFSIKDAWQLNINEKFDLLASNGLAIYEPDDKKVVALYRQFYNALKPNGVFITSFLSPPPAHSVETEWRLEQVDLEDALLQKIVFGDVLGVKWQVFRTEGLVKSQLREAGFNNIEIIYDKAHIFPTVIAKKL